VNLVVLESDEVSIAGEATLADARAAHLLDVLRVTPGARVRVGLVDGPLGTAVVTTIAPPAVSLRCSFEPAPPQRPGIDLLLALPRPKVLRRLWAQLAALGVGQIILTNASRVERNYFDSHVLEPASYRPLLVEGLQQARDTWVPRVSVHRQFRILVEDHLDTLSDARFRVVAHPQSRARVRDVLGDPDAGRILLAVGPEGGWNEFELALLESRGFQPVGLGARTLRVDTACLVLLGIVHEAINKAGLA
jgi:16S rRNA (uracil1498-N3)-methyltransferase